VLKELGDRLIPARLRRRLRPEQRLLIVSSGSLHGLPWAALQVEERWLVEQVTPQLLPGLLAWQKLIRRSVQGNDALLVGVSAFGARAPALAGVQATLARIEGLWPGRVTRLEEAAASVSALFERAAQGGLRRYGLIQFATHGQLVANNGLFAHLKLADDDLLYDDILRLQLAGALVVLGACEGATSEVLPGEEILSLSRAFLSAGARDVIASEWQLYDKTAPFLFELLYRGLVAGLDAPTALAHTQRAWLRRETGDSELDLIARMPLVWASLCALGAGSSAQGE
jgi:CHAT domain-containing protein